MQEEYYYLTFYPGRHILKFYDYFTQDAPAKDLRQICETLLHFVNPDAQLPLPGGILKVDSDKKNHEEVLCNIGEEKNFPKSLIRRMFATERLSLI